MYMVVIGIFGSLIWSKILMELIFNHCGEFRWSPESPVSQIHCSHLHAGAPGIFSDLLRSVHMLKREWREATGSYRTYQSLVKLQPRFLSLRWKTCLWAELQPWFLSLHWRTYPLAEYSHDDDDDDDVVYGREVGMASLWLSSVVAVNMWTLVFTFPWVLWHVIEIFVCNTNYGGTLK